MKNSTNITYTDMEALDFVASRLLNFKRIERTLLMELLENKFSRCNVPALIDQLTVVKALCISHDSFIILNEKTLRAFCLTYTGHGNGLTMMLAA